MMKNMRPASLVIRLLQIATIALAGCVDLTLPPQKDDSGAGGFRSDTDALLDGRSLGSGGSGGAGGSAGSGGQSGTTSPAWDVAPDPDDIADALRGGAGGAPAGGAGGTATGGTGGGVDASTGAGGSTGISPDGAMAPSDTTEGDGIADAPAGTNDGLGGHTVDSAPDVPSIPGLLAYYPCERTEGATLRDVSGHGNHGTLQTAQPGGYRFESGRVGDGLTLVQANSGYVSLPPAMFRTLGELTIAAWIKVNSLTMGQRLFDVGVNANLSQNTATGTSYLEIFLKDMSGKLGLSSTNNGLSNVKQATAEALPAGTWRHVAIVLGNGGGTLYIDGVAAAFANSILPPQALGNIDYAFIGRSQFSAAPFIDAEIDELRVYGRALSANEIQKLLN